MGPDFSSVTELPGQLATREQLARLYHRYHLVTDYSHERRVLEVACGAGVGLGYLARKARLVIGGDYTWTNVMKAQQFYQGRVGVLGLDAQALPFPPASFDTVVMFEGIYYLPAPERFVTECRRIVAPAGVVLISSANKDWPDFIPSRHAVRYLSATELHDLLSAGGFTVEMYGAFPTMPHSLSGKVISHVRRVATALHLVPRTLRGRVLLKRLFYGQLRRIGPEVEEGMEKLYPLVPIPHGCPNSDFKILYAIARLNPTV